MSTPALAPVTPISIDEARNRVRTSNFFGLCYLMLCQLSYLGEDNRQKALDQIKLKLPDMPVPDATAGDEWRLSWGPAASPDNSNLMYGAELMDMRQNPPVPVFCAVVIRGTDLEAKPAGIIKQIIEDLDAAEQVPLPFPNNDPNARIAKGTKIGFDTLLTSPDFVDPVTHKPIDQYVGDFLANNPNAPVVVTGHSLGGCQTTIMALHLALKFPQGTIVPNSFAAPTAGNAAFVELYEQKCPFSPRWFNSLDLVPNAYASLDGIKKLWTACHRPAPLLVKIAIEGLKIVLGAAGATYAQESDSESRNLDGVCQPPGTDAVPAGLQNETTLAIYGMIRDSVRQLQSKGQLSDAVRNVEADLRDSRFLGEIAHLLHLDKLVALAMKNLTLIEKLALRDFPGWVEELLFQHFILTGYWNSVQNFPDVAFISNPFPKAAAAAGAGD